MITPKRVKKSRSYTVAVLDPILKPSRSQGLDASGSQEGFEPPTAGLEVGGTA